MEIYEFTEEEREELIDLAFKGMHIERKRLTKEDLEGEIIDYLSKTHPCSLATCGKDGTPRISVVDYVMLPAHSAGHPGSKQPTVKRGALFYPVG